MSPELFMEACMFITPEPDHIIFPHEYLEQLDLASVRHRLIHLQ